MPARQGIDRFPLQIGFR